MVVVGSNDGNIVARSDEAKALGIPMGAPMFQYEALIKAQNIAVCSANWALYGDLSARVMATLAEFTSELEVYSVDEAFLRLPPLSPAELTAYARDIRATVRQHTKLPSSVGVANTKTLAKAANKRAKKTASGVLVVQSEEEIDALLERTPVEDVWNIGPKRAWLLATRTEYPHRFATEARARSVGQAASERGGPARGAGAAGHALCAAGDGRRSRSSRLRVPRRSGSRSRIVASLKEAAASYMVRAAQRLRDQRSKASHLTLYLQTNPFRTDQPQYARSCGMTLEEPTCATGTLITAAHTLLAHLYRPGFSYHRVGVFLQGLVPDRPTQLSLFTEPERLARQEAASRVADQINRRLGRGTITFASVGKEQRWRAKSANRSPRWTTRLDELPLVR